MPFPIRTCVVCGEEFELRPNKPGFANRCYACSESEANAEAGKPGKVINWGNLEAMVQAEHLLKKLDRLVGPVWRQPNPFLTSAALWHMQNGDGEMHKLALVLQSHRQPAAFLSPNDLLLVEEVEREIPTLLIWLDNAHCRGGSQLERLEKIFQCFDEREGPGRDDKGYAATSKRERGREPDEILAKILTAAQRHGEILPRAELLRPFDMYRQRGHRNDLFRIHPRLIENRHRRHCQ